MNNTYSNMIGLPRSLEDKEPEENKDSKTAPPGRSFYKRTMTITFLAEVPIPEMSLVETYSFVQEGDGASRVRWEQQQQISIEEMVDELFSIAKT